MAGKLAISDAESIDQGENKGKGSRGQTVIDQLDRRAEATPLTAKIPVAAGCGLTYVTCHRRPAEPSVDEDNAGQLS